MHMKNIKWYMLDNVNMNSVWGWWSQKKKKGRKKGEKKKHLLIEEVSNHQFSPFVNSYQCFSEKAMAPHSSTLA